MKSYIFGPVKSYSEIRKINTGFFDMSYYDNGYTAGYTGAGSTAAQLAKIFIGISGPSGASSGKYNYTPYAKIFEYQGGETLAQGVTVGWFNSYGITGPTG